VRPPSHAVACATILIVTAVIAVSHLGKRYGRTVAVEDVSLDVFEGRFSGS
jgi:ABC-type branched-subunit amino acid transport system ATPase component